MLKTQSDEEGKFSFSPVEAGKYRLEITFVSYAVYHTPYFDIAGNKDMLLEPARLRVEGKSLKEVTVTGKHPAIERHGNKTILNVTNNAVFQNSNAGELLQQIPGLTMGKGGAMRLDGKTGVTILIDGKKNPLSPEQLSEFLENMPSNAISKIEVLTNPPAKYDALGAAGIINIVTRKENGAGLNGVLSSGYNQGTFANYIESFLVNYKKEKFNYFASYNYSRLHKSVEYVWDRSVAGTNPLHFHEQTNFLPHFNNHVAKFNVDYDIDQKNYLGLDLNVSSMNKIRSINDMTWISDQFNQPASNYHTLTDNTKRLNNGAVNVNYIRKLDTSGQNVAINYGYSHYGNTDEKLNGNFSYNTNGTFLQAPAYIRTNAPFNINMHSAAVDYALPLKNGIKIESGLKDSYVSQGNQLNFDSLYTGYYKSISDKSNNFSYTENVAAFYVNASKSIGSLDVSMGLRVEHTRSVSDLVSAGRSTAYKYLDWFPNISVSKKFSEDHHVDLSVNRRIDRPSYQDLDPSTIYVDDFYYVQGNPLLRPQYSNTITLTETFKDQYIATLSFSRTDRPITNIIQMNSATNIATATVINLDLENTVNMSFEIPVSVCTWWDIDNSLDAFYDQYKTGNYMGKSYNRQQYAFSFSTMHTFNFSNSWRGEISFKYDSPQIYGLSKQQSFSNLSAGFQKSFMKKKADIKLSVFNMLNKMVFINHYAYANVNAREVNYNDLRQLRVAFTYRFGGKFNKKDWGNKERNGVDSRIKDK